MRGERETAFLALRAEANKLRSVLALIPGDSQQLSFQLNTFVQYCSRLQLPELAHSRRASSSLTTLSDVLETVAPDCMKHAMLLKKHATIALSSSGDAALLAQIDRCVTYAESLDDCGRMTLDTKAVAKLLADAEDCEIRSGLSNPFDMLQGVLDCCIKIDNLPEHILVQLASVEDALPDQPLQVIREDVPDAKGTKSLKDDHAPLVKLLDQLDDILSQVVAAAKPLHLDIRQVDLAVSGVEAVHKCLLVLKELPRAIEPLVAKLDMVSEVTSFGARTAREVAHSAKASVKTIRRRRAGKETLQSMKAKLRRACCVCHGIRERLDYSDFAPLVIVALYAIGIAAAVSGVVVLLVAMLRGLKESLPSLGVAGIVCVSGGVVCCVLGAVSSCILRAMANISIMDHDEETRELEERVLEIKRARRKAAQERLKHQLEENALEASGDLEAGAAHLPNSMLSAPSSPTAHEDTFDSSARLIFGDSDKGLAAEMQALGAQLPANLGHLGAAAAPPKRQLSSSSGKPPRTASSSSGTHAARPKSQELLQDLFKEGRQPEADRSREGSRSSSMKHPLLQGVPSSSAGRDDMASRGSARSTESDGGSTEVFSALMKAMGGGDDGADTAAAQSSASVEAAAQGNAEPPRAKPSAQELTQYARYLGINPIYDSDLLWIAEQAYDAPLPANWAEAQDQDGNIYYYNTVTAASSWSHPLEDHFRSLVLQMRNDKNRKRSNSSNASSLPPISKPGSSQSARTGAVVNILNDDDDDDVTEATDTDLDSLNTTMDMSQSAASLKGMHQNWDAAAQQQDGSPAQPFIRSFGKSAGLEASLKAARAGHLPHIKPPPLPGQGAAAPAQVKASGSQHVAPPVHTQAPSRLGKKGAGGQKA